ncbi:alkaline phosphatase family protein, partial [Dolichospermum sp. ST_sed3]|nr:alkaline phosphatase family protein [Dolichospermum sp. ST_sed3]
MQRSKKDQAYWQLIGRQQPQLWLWLGDNIYADRAELKERRQWYQLQKSSLHYREFWEKIPIIGTWDDHDYYTENASGSYAEKDASKDLMLEFLDVGAEHPVRQHLGVYQNYELGPEGQKTQIIMLDLRYFQNRNKCEPELLGAQQWNFLESAIADSSSNLLIIGSSLNVCSSLRVPHLEGWYAFPNERKRLYELLASTDKPCIFLSGAR